MGLLCEPEPYLFSIHSDSVDVYDPVLNIWTVASFIPTPRYLHNSTLIDGKIHVREEVLKKFLLAQ